MMKVASSAISKNIAIVITRADRAGAQIHVKALLAAMNHTHRFTLICGNHGFLTEEAAKLGCEVIIIDSMRRRISILKDISAARKLFKILSKLRPNLVHAHSSKAGLLARIVCWRLQIPVVFTVHGWSFSPGNTWLKRFILLRLEKLAARVSDVIITVSDFDLRIAENVGIKAIADIRSIVNGVEDRFTSFNTFSSIPPCKIASLARFAPQKNLACLIRALALVEADFHAVIAGSGPDLKDIELLVKQYGLRYKVTIPGETCDPTGLLRRADMFVLSSRWEGLPLAVIEAMSASLPIVSTNVGGLSELVDDGKNGYLVKANDHIQLASKIDELANDAQLRVRMGRQSRERYEDNFMLDRMISSTLDVYSGLSEGSL